MTAALETMKQHYAVHRVAINKLVELATKRNEGDEADALVRRQTFEATREVTERVQHHDAAFAGLPERRIESFHVVANRKAALPWRRPIAGGRLEINTGRGGIIQLLDRSTLGRAKRRRDINPAKDRKWNGANQEIATNNFASAATLHNRPHALLVLLDPHDRRTVANPVSEASGKRCGKAIVAAVNRHLGAAVPLPLRH